MDIVKSNIANALTSAAKDHVLGVANDIYDESQEKYQSEINKELLDNKNSNTDITNLNETIDKIVEIISTINGNTNIEKLISVKTTLDGLGNGYKNVVELATTLKSFITNTDVTNETINSWKEIENFLQGVTDTETLTGLLEELKTELENKITENTSNIKNVDNKTLVIDENGIAKVNFNDAYSGSLFNTVFNTRWNVRTYFNVVNNKLEVNNETYVYDGTRILNPYSVNLVEERALYKVVQSIPNIKIFEITYTSDNTELFNFVQANTDNYKKVLIKFITNADEFILLTIYSFTDDTITTSTYYSKSLKCQHQIIINSNSLTDTNLQFSSEAIESLNGQKIMNGTIGDGKFTQDIQQRFTELQQVIAKANTNSTNITNIITLLNNFGLTDTFDTINNDYIKLLNIIGVTVDAEQLTELTTKFTELGDNYSTLYKVAKTLHDFLDNNDVSNTTINRWREIESFLAGITDDKTLLGIVNDSISSNNENYYDKTYIDSKVATIPNIKFFTVTNNSDNTELFNYISENEENYKNVYITYVHNNNTYIFNINNYTINNSLDKFIITNNVLPQNNDESPFIKLHITPSKTTIYRSYIYYNNIRSIDGTIIIPETIQTSSLSTVLQNKINNIPNLKIFALGTDNTELINYITDNRHNDVLVIYNNKLLTLVNNNTTETYIGDDGTLVYYTFNANNVVLHNRALIGQSIVNKSIVKEKLADSLLTELLTTSSIATDEELTEILNNI